MNSASETTFARSKRALDLVASAAALSLLWPLLGLAALGIWASMGRPILFRARRPGLRAQPFTLLKFRTMRDLFDSAGKPLPDKLRITPLGRFLRRSSLDELPQLLNVLKGDMSLVGPRPLRLDYVPLYTPEQARRHLVKPGITGVAQINGRNALSWDEKFALDVWYVDHGSLVLDFRILLQTVVYVLRRRSISADGDLDVPSFTGSMPANHAEASSPAISSSSS
jgi:lipopolysaccharide/colanic/teichoic acid biosynthesis glycosyltransferase